jgi:predicted PolB exonuclease-like 3'-5' exonuclease
MKPSVIVWDLETVPDLAGFAAANDLVGNSDADIRAALGNKFPKHIYHTIVCIGALVAHRENDHWAVDALGAPHVGERTEKQLISAFCEKIAELAPQLVTFNGNSFDLPVLRYRAMIHGISAPGLAVRPYFNRYTEDAVDLCDILSSFAPHSKASLNELSKIMGMPERLPHAVRGHEVVGRPTVAKHMFSLRNLGWSKGTKADDTSRPQEPVRHDRTGSPPSGIQTSTPATSRPPRRT